MPRLLLAQSGLKHHASFREDERHFHSSRPSWPYSGFSGAMMLLVVIVHFASSDSSCRHRLEGAACLLSAPWAEGIVDMGSSRSARSAADGAVDFGEGARPARRLRLLCARLACLGAVERLPEGCALGGGSEWNSRSSCLPYFGCFHCWVLGWERRWSWIIAEWLQPHYGRFESCFFD